MRSLRAPLLALAVVALAGPALAEGCSWGQHQTTEKPKEQVQNPST